MTTLNIIIDNADKIQALAEKYGFGDVYTFWDTRDRDERVCPTVNLVVKRVAGKRSSTFDAFELAVVLEKEFTCKFRVVLEDSLNLNGKIMTGIKFPIQDKSQVETFFSPRTLESVQIKDLNKEQHILEYRLFHENNNVARNTESYEKQHNYFLQKLASREYTPFYGEQKIIKRSLVKDNTQYGSDPSLEGNPTSLVPQ